MQTTLRAAVQTRLRGTPPEPTRIFDILALPTRVLIRSRTHSRHKVGRRVAQIFHAGNHRHRARALAAGLRAAGVGPGDRVANVTENNRPEWNFIDLAVLQLGAVHVPIYPTLTRRNSSFILTTPARNWCSHPARRSREDRRRGRPAARAGRHFTYDPESPRPPAARRPPRSAGPTCVTRAKRCCSPKPNIRARRSTRWPPPCVPATSPRSSTPPARRANPRVSCSRTPTS